MSVTKKLLEASGGGGESTYVDDVFSTYLYEGDQSNTNRDIVNGIDLDDKGGLVWIKERSQPRFHYLFDTERGTGRRLETPGTGGQSSQDTGTLRSFNTDGFSLGDSYTVNETGEDFASWTWAKQEGFFDVVTYTGDGVAGREIPHNLGSVPGMFIVKRTDNSGNWAVYHKDTTADYVLRLNASYAAWNSSSEWNDTAPTSEVFTVGNDSDTNYNNYEYVAYIFAHDAQEFGPDGDESIIKCGSYTGNGSSDGPEIDLGWEPQWLLIKKATGSADGWIMLDNMRGIVTGGNDPSLQADFSGEEYDATNYLSLTADGFKIDGTSASVNDSGQTHIYMAIRRPNKPAEEFEPDELFAVESNIAEAPSFNAGFPVDMAWRRSPTSTANTELSARLIDSSYLLTNEADAAFTSKPKYTFDFSDGWYDSAADTVDSFVSWMFRRAPGFFDVVAYEGDGQAGREVPHNLSVVPEMMWVKNRSSNGSYWSVYMDQFGGEKGLWLSETFPLQDEPNWWSNTDATDEVFTLGNYSYVNGPAQDYIAYLWASVPGICDIGSYTATSDQAEQVVNCGFTNGARFVLIKRTDEGRGWFYFDTLRGITGSGTDSPALRLDEVGAQDLYDGLHPHSSGFSVVAGDNNTNRPNGEYIYMAIA